MKKENKKAGEKKSTIPPASDKKRSEDSKRSAESQIKILERKGYFKFWRLFTDDPLYKQKRKFSQFEAWLDLYSKAQGLDNPRFVFKKKIVDLKRGELVTSQRILAKLWDWSRGSVENFLRKLEKRGTIAVEVHGRGRGAYTIINFLKYNELNPLNEVGKK